MTQPLPSPTPASRSQFSVLVCDLGTMLSQIASVYRVFGILWIPNYKILTFSTSL